MQNLPFNEVETTPLDLFVSKLKTAWKMMTSKNAIVIIDKDVHIFNLSQTQTISSATNLVANLSNIRHQEAVISAAVNELILN